MLPETATLLASPPGTQLIYHRGFLARDRDMPKGRALHQLASEFLKYSTALVLYEEDEQLRSQLHLRPEAGYIVLLQRRVGKKVHDIGQHEYIAIRSKKPWK